MVNYFYCVFFFVVVAVYDLVYDAETIHGPC